jgi:hypothetical protein
MESGIYLGKLLFYLYVRLTKKIYLICFSLLYIKIAILD